ncbi:hypothetical protein HDU76_004197 [Blyttiomyces sp. JEL0837]|nr:hypothetical protein HDU76_004197 [Blyttiomyces sp. JEL0837]
MATLSLHHLARQRPRGSYSIHLRTISTSKPSFQQQSFTPAAIFSQHGPPESVLSIQNIPLDPITPTTVRIKFLATPINPADINQVQGTYPIKPRFNNGIAIGGNEGVAEIVQVGSHVKGLSKGDLVLPKSSGFGTWRLYANAEPSELLKIDAKGVSPIHAATITVNPCTAFRMLADFVDLKPGDTIIQNGANSSVGQSVIQIAKARNIKTINIIRGGDRPDLNQIVQGLTDLGADLVVTDEKIRSREVEVIVKEVCGGNKLGIRLGLNCVGGKSATNLARLLGDSAPLITYGGMSKEPLTIPTSLLIFRDVQFRGFWMTRWYATCSDQERLDMINQLFGWVREGKFKEPWHQKVSWDGSEGVLDSDKFREVVGVAMKGQSSRKQILVA